MRLTNVSEIDFPTDIFGLYQEILRQSLLFTGVYSEDDVVLNNRQNPLGVELGLQLA